MKQPSSTVSTADTSSPTTVTTSWTLVLVAALILMITMGSRQSLGLFLSPINTQTGLGIAKISFAMAIAQLVWGAIQPIFGAVADRWGPGRVIVLGAFLLAAGSALTTQVTSEWGLIFALGILSAAGAGAGSFSILIGATAQRIAPQQRSLAGGVIGVILGLSVSYVFSVVADFTFIVSPSAIALGVGFSAAVGIAFGWAPARKASALNLRFAVQVAQFAAVHFSLAFQPGPGQQNGHLDDGSGTEALAIGNLNWRLAIRLIMEGILAAQLV